MEKFSSTIIRKTRGVCTHCHNPIEAEIIEEAGKVFMRKSCPVHGSEKIIISQYPWYYKSLTSFYFSVMPSDLKQKRFYVNLTNKCNLNCNICSLNAGNKSNREMPLAAFKEFIKKQRKSYFYLYGAEPTLRDDLHEWIKVIKRYNNHVILYSNGIKLTDFAYLNGIKKCGVDYVNLQFDGFDDNVYDRLRGRKLLDIKLRTLENLRKLNIDTGLNVVIAKGINENQISLVFDYAVKNNFIKDVNFITLSFLGKAEKGFACSSYLVQDELIDLVERQTDGKITRNSIYLFQKFFYSLLSLFKIRRCYNFHQIVIVRDEKHGYVTIDELFGLKEFEASVDKYRRIGLKNKNLANIYLMFKLCYNIISRNFLEKVKCLPPDILLPKTIKTFKRTNKVLWLGVGTICDSLRFDSQINNFCSEGFCLNKGDEIFLSDSSSFQAYEVLNRQRHYEG